MGGGGCAESKIFLFAFFVTKIVFLMDEFDYFFLKPNNFSLNCTFQIP